MRPSVAARRTLAACLALAVPTLAAALPAPNHLRGQSSPDLLEHLHNPVDWYPWGDEALARARRESKPIFLSIGYAACHWCHVMARESFSDPEVARLLNESFVAIKVDREERPDLDAIYMTAVTAMTGGGGWPLSVFLTPDRDPFYGGTYFPRERFKDLLKAIAAAWAGHRQEALASARSVRETIARQQRIERPEGSRRAGAPDADGLVDGALETLRAGFDAENGGFGGPPRFPPHGALSLLLEAPRRQDDPGALDMAVATLDAMARGGLYDQIGGGFHRYSTDARWLVPHFEKMLYDNALLVPVYLEAWKRTGREDFRRVVTETLEWVAREMTDPQGGFYATLDADSEGEEGRYYLWTIGEVRDALAPADADLAIAYYGLSEEGSAGGGRNVLHVPVAEGVFARQRGLAEPDLRARLRTIRARLAEARARRVPPQRDDKVLSAWNGLMISAYARAFAATGDARYRAAAERAAGFVLSRLRAKDGRLLATWRRGVAKVPGYLDDSAFLARGLLDLNQATSEPSYLEAARGLTLDADRFLDPGDGGYFFTAAGRGDLIVRTKDLQDSMLPSGNAVMAECLIRLGRLPGGGPFQRRAERLLSLAAPSLRRAPLSSPYMILAAQAMARPATSDRPVLASARIADARPAGAGAAPGIAPAPPAAARRTPVAGEKVITGSIVGRPGPQRVVDAALTIPAREVRPGQAVTISLRLDIHPGWHVNSNRPSLAYLIPTRLEFPEPAAAAVDQVAYPEGEMVQLKFAAEKLSVYQGATTIRATLRPPRDAPAGARRVPVRVVYQACSDQSCLAPETVEFAVPLTVLGEPVGGSPAEPGPGAAAATAGAGPVGAGDGTAGWRPPGGGVARGDDRLARLMAEQGLLFVLGAVFLAGLALNLTPCVYPMMPVTIGFFAGQAQGAGWGRRVALPALYVLGMALTYSTLGVIAGLSGSLFGSALQKPWVALVALFVAMALWMFGVFELRLPGALSQVGGGRRGALGALVMGLTMGVVAAPCIGPFVVGLLAFVGASGNPLLGFWLFFVLALGMGLPNLVLGIFSGALASLPRSGAWLIYAKKVMGVALLGVALYFMQPLLSDRHLGMLALAFAAAAGVYLAFLERTRMRAGWFPLLKAGIGLAVVACGAWLALPLVSARAEAAWAPYGGEAVAAARERGRPVLIDFYADWCLPCRELDRFTFNDPRVLLELERFALLKADLTSFEAPSVRALRDRYDVVGVPTIVLIDGSGRDQSALRLYGFEEPEAFLARLRQVR